MCLRDCFRSHCFLVSGPDSVVECHRAVFGVLPALESCSVCFSVRVLQRSLLLSSLCYCRRCITVVALVAVVLGSRSSRKKFDGSHSLLRSHSLVYTRWRVTTMWQLTLV